MNKRTIRGFKSASALWRMKSMLILSMLLLTALAACGNAPSGTRSGINVPLSVAPTTGTLTVTGNGSGNCTPGFSLTANYQVNGGFPPYQIFSSVPQLTGFTTRTLVNSGDILAITATCPLTITGFSDLLIIDDKGTQVTAKFTVTFAPGTPLAITNTSPLAAGVVNQPYNVVMAATGGTAPLVWSLQSGVIPPGLTLDPVTGILSGIPTTAGTFSFVVALVDANGLTTFGSFTITVTGALTITTATLPNGAVNQFYNVILAASIGANATGAGGQPCNNCTWALTTGALPPGMTLDPATGIISGTTTAAGTFNFIVTATDPGLPVANNTAMKSLSLTIVDTLTGLKIATTALPAATNGIAYSAALAATGGVPPLTWAITGGALPVGLTLADTVNGIISGTPNDTGGTYNLTVSVTDSAGTVAFGQVSLSLTGAAAPTALAIPTPALPDATNGVVYSGLLNATGGTPPYTWALAGGALPTGLNLPTTGIISGTPNDVPGTYNLVVKVTDSAAATVTAAAVLTLLPGGTLAITTTSPLPTGTTTLFYSTFMAASGGTPPYTWTSTTLPTGLTLVASTGEIAGTPTASGNTTVTVTVTDSATPTAASTFRSFSLPINGTGAALTITTPSPLPVGTSTVAYGPVTLLNTGGTAPFTWAVVSGALPPGMTLSTAGVLSGTPTTPGVSSFVVTVTDAAPATAAVGFSLTIN